MKMDVRNFKVATAAVLLSPSLLLAAPILQNTSDQASAPASIGLFGVGSNGLASSSNFIDFIETGAVNAAGSSLSGMTGNTLEYTSTVNASPLVATFGGLVRGQTVDLLLDAAGDVAAGGGTPGPNSRGTEAIRPLALANGSPAAINTGVSNPFGFDENYGPRQSLGGYSETGTGGAATPYQAGTAGPVALDTDNNNMFDRVLTGYGVQGRPFDPVGSLINGFGSITIVFDELVSAFGGYIGSLEQAGSVTLVTYLDDGSVYGAVSNALFSGTPGIDQYNLLSIEDSVGENIIRAATFYQELSDGAGFEVDYVAFEQTGQQAALVPVPASLSLLALGLVGFTVRRKPQS